MCLQIIYDMYEENLALNNLHWLIWYKTQPNLIKLSCKVITKYGPLMT